jgi:hypothetical protein
MNGAMTWHTWFRISLIVLFAILQYGLMVYAIRDLLRRPRVRGNNKIVWGFFILIVPIAGALIYTVYGPTSFLPRANRPPRRPEGWDQRHDIRLEG